MFNPEIYLADPKHCVKFQIFDENGQPLRMQYTSEELDSLEDDRLFGLHVLTQTMSKLFGTLVDKRNEERKKLAEEMKQLLAESVQVEEIPKEINATGMSCPNSETEL